MRKKKKTNYKKYIFIMVFSIIVMFIILIKLFNIRPQNINKQSNNQENLNNSVPEIVNEENSTYDNVVNELNENFIQDKKIVPENYNFLTRLYDGNLDDTVLYERIYRLVFEAIPDINNELKEKDDIEIESYYQIYQEEIYYLIGIENQEEFIKFVKAISKICDGKYVSSAFEVNNFYKNEKYSVVDLTINFTTGNITLKVYILNNTVNDFKDIIFKVK